MNARVIGITGSLLVACAFFGMACGSSSPTRSGFTKEVSPVEPPPDGGPTGFGTERPGNGSECAINNVSNDKEKDFDGDGYALKDDCNECNTSINKGAHDIPGNGTDEDCSGTPDDEEVDCDANLSKEGNDPFDGAKAMGLCKKADPDGKDWGVIEAKWVMPDGTSLSNKEGVGILPNLGVNAPQAGGTMLVLSSGSARDPKDPQYESSSNTKGYTHGTPDGYPKESPACPNVKTGTAQDGAALELKIRVPSNVLSFSYQQNFFTWEYPVYICSQFNDFFVTMLEPKPDGLDDGNIAFDQDTNPISVNNSLLQVCTPGKHGNPAKDFPCPLGIDTLKDTGFEGHAATGWLTTTAPVKAGTEITVRFAIWDSGDGALDSTVLLDNFVWSTDGADTTTKPTPEPK